MTEGTRAEMEQSAHRHYERPALPLPLPPKLALKPLSEDRPEASLAAALEHHRAGRLSEAETLYRMLILGQPEHAEAWTKLSMLLRTSGSLDEAVQAASTALALRPESIDAHVALIEALAAACRYPELEAAYRRAMVVVPHRPELPSNLGQLLEAAGNAEEALSLYRRALTIQPDFTNACLAAAQLLARAHRYDEATAIYEAALAVRPDFVEALSNFGMMLGELGRLAEAVAHTGKAFSLMPNHPEVALNFGVALQRSGNAGDAERVYAHSIVMDPGRPKPYANRGVALEELRRFDEAAASLDQAVAIKPDFDAAVVEGIKVRRHICDWSRYEADRAALLGLLERETEATFLLLMMSFDATPAQLMAGARQSMEPLNRRGLPARPRPAPAKDGRLRIGYLSHDYREHPVGRLLPELFARHDRERFAVTAYSLGAECNGSVRRRIREGVERFVDLHQVSDREAAAMIAGDGIDILVDLTGAMTGSRLPILLHRPAPVQVSYLGWPGTMGLEAIDYVVADHFLAPPGQEANYTEKLLRLPEVYQASDNGRGNPEIALTRQELGLPPKGFVFCSFNNTSKLTPETFACWMRILAQVPGSVLWLYSKTPQTNANLVAAAARHGIAAERIVFASFLPTDLYLSRFRVADLFLDELPYNAGATCNDALWSGLPVLTRAGHSYIGRMAGSLLTAVGLPELVTDSAEAYEAMAVQLATKPRKMAAIKRKLAKARDSAPLFDMARFTRHLEAGFMAMHARHEAGQEPDHIEVARIED